MFVRMQYTTTLSQVTQWYNKLHGTILDVELRLVEAEMEDVRRTLSPALRNLRWSQVELWDYIMRLYTYSDGIIPITVFSMFGIFFLTFNVHKCIKFHISKCPMALSASNQVLCDFPARSTRDLVRGMSERVQKSQANLDTVQALMGVFSKSAWVPRRSSLHGDLLYMADVEEKFKQQYRLISDTGERIHALVQVHFLFFVLSKVRIYL